MGRFFVNFLDNNLNFCCPPKLSRYCYKKHCAESKIFEIWSINVSYVHLYCIRLINSYQQIFYNIFPGFSAMKLADSVPLQYLSLQNMLPPPPVMLQTFDTEAFPCRLKFRYSLHHQHLFAISSYINQSAVVPPPPPPHPLHVYVFPVWNNSLCVDKPITKGIFTAFVTEIFFKEIIYFSVYFRLLFLFSLSSSFIFQF
jgi:hypothetical protein